jgi:hypothetical protein
MKVYMALHIVYKLLFHQLASIDCSAILWYVNYYR